MTRLDSVTSELQAILAQWADVIQRKSMTSLHIRIRLFPNGGLVRHATVSVEEEREIHGLRDQN